MRHISPVGLAWVLLSLTLSPLPAQYEPRLVLDSLLPEAYAHFGASVSGVPDVDGDGVWDLVVGAPEDDSAEGLRDMGTVYLISGADGAPIRVITSPIVESSGLFGVSVSGVPDIDGDGFGDILVGAPGEELDGEPSNVGRAHLISGATGNLIRTLSLPGGIRNSWFGGLVKAVADLNGDGVSDLLISSQLVQIGTEAFSGGSLSLFSGATGEPRRQFVSPNDEPGGEFGRSVAVVPDADGDARPDLLIGAPWEDPGDSPTNAGRAYIMSSATGSLIREFRSPGEQGYGYFGFSVATLDDFDGDGSSDFAIGAPLETEGAGIYRDDGSVYIHSGRTHEIIAVLTDPTGATDSEFGSALAPVPDVNGDGADDLLITTLRGFHLVSSATGLVVLSSQVPETIDSGGSIDSMAGFPDMDGDGRGDFALGVELADFVDIVTLRDAGRVFLYSGPPIGPEHPEILVTPTEIDYEEVRLDLPEVSANVSIRNLGNGDLTLTGEGVTIQGTTPEAFALRPQSPIDPIPPGGRRDVEIAVVSADTGIKQAELVITTDDFDEPTITIPLEAVVHHPDALFPQLPLGESFSLRGVEELRADSSWRFPQGIAYGDVDGDGHDDLILGAPLAGRGSLNAAGTVSVVWGDLIEPETSLNLWLAGVPSSRETRMLGSEPNGFLGWAVASGDINGDGYDDVVMGVPRLDSETAGDDAGTVCVVYGGTIQRGEILFLGSRPGIHGETCIHGPQGGMYVNETFGKAVAVGDVNGDGFGDIIVGGPLGSPPTGFEAGRVYVIFGGQHLPGAVIDLADGPGVHGEARVHGSGVGEHLGFSLATGDVDGDGLDDVVIGANRASEPGVQRPGRGYVVFGRGLVPAQEVDVAAAVALGDATLLVTDGRADGLGHDVATGDIDGDGRDDAIITAPFSSPEERDQAGEIFGVFGDASLAGRTVSLREDRQILRLVGRSSSRASAQVRDGMSVSSADVNGDGSHDVIITAYYGYYAVPTRSVLQMIWGGAHRLDSVVDLSAPNLFLRSTWANRVNSSGGDLNRDGFPEFTGATKNSQRLSYTVFGAGEAREATVTEWLQPGVAPARGFGGRLSPVIRLWLGFQGGDDGTGAAARATATLTRSSAAVTGLDESPLTGLANVTWEISTPRIGWAHAIMRLQYTDAEIQGLDEETLQLWRSPGHAGPWTLVEPQSLDTRRNEVSAQVTSLGVFALMAENRVGLTGRTSEEILDHLLGRTGPLPGMDVNGDEVIDIGDLVANVLSVSED